MEKWLPNSVASIIVSFQSCQDYAMCCSVSHWFNNVCLLPTSTPRVISLKEKKKERGGGEAAANINNLCSYFRPCTLTAKFMYDAHWYTQICLSAPCLHASVRTLVLHLGYSNKNDGRKTFDIGLLRPFTALTSLDVRLLGHAHTVHECVLPEFPLLTELRLRGLPNSVLSRARRPHLRVLELEGDCDERLVKLALSSPGLTTLIIKPQYYPHESYMLPKGWCTMLLRALPGLQVFSCPVEVDDNRADDDKKSVYFSSSSSTTGEAATMCLHTLNFEDSLDGTALISWIRFVGVTVTSLNLGDSHLVNRALTIVADHFPRLNALMIAHNPDLNDLRPLSSLSGLQVLDATNCGLGTMATMPSLTDCHLPAMPPSVLDDHLSKWMPNLYSLDMGQINMASYKSFKCLKELPHLHTLDLKRAFRLTMGHVRSILSNMEQPVSRIRLPDSHWMDAAQFVFFLSQTKLLFDREPIPASMLP